MRQLEGILEAGVGEVAAVQQAARVDHPQQTVDLVRQDKPGQVEVELAVHDGFHFRAADLRLAAGQAGADAGEALEDGRQGAAGVGDDDFDVRVARCGPGRDQVDEDADLLEQKVEHGRRVAAQGQVVVGDGDGVVLVVMVVVVVLHVTGRRRVDEDGRAAALELGEDGL